jgi:hypothetical protein
MTIDDRIASLGDLDAIGRLQRFSRAQPKHDVPSTLDASVCEQFRAELDLSEESVRTPSEGELARAALRVIASDPEHQIGMQALLDHPQTEKFVVVETAVLVPLVLIALQTHFKFERDQLGKWTVKVEKKPTDASLLKDLVKKLLSLGLSATGQ